MARITRKLSVGADEEDTDMIRGKSIVSFLGGAVVLLLAALSLAACGSSGKKASASAAPSTTIKVQPATATVGVANTGLGTILVDAQGRTLYMLSADTATKSACTGQCPTFWPPLTMNGSPTAGSGANASLLGTITRSDGTSQVTYNRHPLYTFAKDQKAGDTNGQGVVAFGGTWSVLAPAGNQVSGKASSPSTSSPPTTSKPQPASVGVANTGLGNVLVNSQGRTLYMLSADSRTTSACTGQCATFWPPLTMTGSPTAGSGANASLLGTIKRTDGSSQVTYNGHPLYTFAQDAKAGDTNGQGVVAFGGTWRVLSPSGAQIG
jgi:predicted lipoprotein with Yx(FWY)xxD motif